jgi:hypothetical protein
MRLTAEIRWFWPCSSKTRVDEYLRDPDQDSLGIKKRGRGEVEIKWPISFATPGNAHNRAGFGLFRSPPFHSHLLISATDIRKWHLSVNPKV